MELDLNNVRFGTGSHLKPETVTGNRDMCIMETVAFVAGERWTDRPACASPLISFFFRCWQDTLCTEDRDRLLPAAVWVPRLVGSVADKGIEERRAHLLWDWLTRDYTPAWLSAHPATSRYADTLRRLSPIVDEESRRAVIPTVRDLDLELNWRKPASRQTQWNVWSVMGRTGGKSARTSLYGNATGRDPLLLLDTLKFIQHNPIDMLLLSGPISLDLFTQFENSTLAMLDRLLVVE